MKLNIGSGYTRYDGWENVDSDEGTRPDIIMDLNNANFASVPDNAVDEIRAYHILEHIGEGFFQLLKELYRICQNGAIIDVRVPHPRHDYFFGDPTHIRPITIEMMGRFSKQNNLAELASGPGTTPFAINLGVDFEIIDFNYILEPWFHEAIKQCSDDQINLMARMYSNAIQEIHFKMKVIK